MKTVGRAGTTLVGDVGGTHLRLALAHRRDGVDRLSAIEIRAHGAAFDLTAEAAAFVAKQGERIGAVALAVAGPVTDGAVSLTNAAGVVSETALSEALGGAPVRLLNDFEALAMAAPALAEGDLHFIGEISPIGPSGTITLLGPGTGLGVSALVRDGRGRAVAVSEGGHVGFAPFDDVEVEILRAISAAHGRCSLERILCGPGLMILHATLGGVPAADPAALLTAANAGEGTAVETLERFCAILGSAAGDAALMFGARAGVMLGGGLSPRILPWLERGGFRQRFEAKGRFAAYLAAIPTAVIMNPHAALLGAARAFD